MSRILDFYRGQSTDDVGRTIDVIWGFDRLALEWTHDFIQWLFPLESRSGANPGAPTLDAETIAAFEHDPALQGRLRRSLDLMLDFYGFERRGEGTVAVVTEAAGEDRRLEEWVTPGNHNFLRVTRILRSLTTLGLAGEANAFHAALSRLYAGPAGSIIGPRTFEFWLDAVNRKGAP